MPRPGLVATVRGQRGNRRRRHQGRRVQSCELHSGEFYSGIRIRKCKCKTSARRRMMTNFSQGRDRKIRQDRLERGCSSERLESVECCGKAIVSTVSPFLEVPSSCFPSPRLVGIAEFLEPVPRWQNCTPKSIKTDNELRHRSVNDGQIVLTRTTHPHILL